MGGGMSGMSSIPLSISLMPNVGQENTQGAGHQSDNKKKLKHSSLTEKKKASTSKSDDEDIDAVYSDSKNASPEDGAKSKSKS